MVTNLIKSASCQNYNNTAMKKENAALRKPLAASSVITVPLSAAQTDSFNRQNLPVQQPSTGVRLRNIINIIPDSYLDEVGAVVGVAIAGFMGKGKFSNFAKQFTDMVKNVNELTEANKASKETIKNLQETLINLLKRETGLTKTQIEELIGQKGFIDDAKLNEKFSEIFKNATDLTDAKIAKLKEFFTGMIDRIRAEFTNLVPNSTRPFPTETIEANGRIFNVATILPGSKLKDGAAENLAKQLQTQAAKQILGTEINLGSVVPKKANVAIVTSEYTGFAKTGGLAIVPKEITENFAKVFANAKDQDISTTLYMPLYLGRLDGNTFRTLVKAPDSSTSYLYKTTNPNTGAESIVAVLEKVHSFDTELYSDSTITRETVNVFAGKQFVDLENARTYIRKLPSDIKKQINALKYEESASEQPYFDFNNIRYTRNKDKTIRAQRIIDTIFLDNGSNGKFALDMSQTDVKENGIYSNTALSTGETERFLCFDKFLYDLFTDTRKPQDLVLPDMIVGNDWHTGGLSALLKLLTPVNEAYNEIDAQLAKKLSSIPQITILHNAGLAGEAYHSQDKLINLLFGNKAATVLQNAHVNLYVNGRPQTSLNCSLWNGLLHGTGRDGTSISPQTMAIAYSDVVVPVSRGYAKEISTNSAYGGDKLQLYAARAKEGIYSDRGILTEIAHANNTNFANSNMLTEPTLIGITNGCDRANNTINDKTRTNLIEGIGDITQDITKYLTGEEVLPWHNRNKSIGIEVLKRDVGQAKLTNGTNNPMKIVNPESVDLSDITVDTPIITSAGRVTDQKGIDIWAQSIVEFAKKYKGDNPPVFYLQGLPQSADDQRLIDAFLNAKKEVEKINPTMAKRMLYAALFKEKGRYDMAKIFSDFAIMPSWFEPCGLSHKEIALFSGAVPIVNKTGGLLDGFELGKNAFAADFTPERWQIGENANNLANAMLDAINCYQNEPQKFAQMVDASFHAQFDWATNGGPLEQYLRIGRLLNVFSNSTAKTNL